jgi:MarR family transcriptional regulator, organic hydroperoxide resistance regulator
MKAEVQGGFLITKIKHLSGRIFARMLRDHEIEINPAQGRIIFVLWQEDALPISELANRTGLGKSTLTSMLDRLEAAGFLVRERSESDRRLVLVKRTPKDRAFQEEYEKVSKQMGDVFYAGLDKAEIAQFERTLLKILDNLTEYERRDPA